MTGTTKSMVFDSFALLSFLKGEAGSAKVEECLGMVRSKEIAGYISAANLSEVYYIVWRERGGESAEILVNSLKDWGLNIIPVDKTLRVDEDIAMRAGQLKAQYPLSLADAFATARSQKLEVDKTLRASLLSGDPEFKKLAEVVEVEWL
jgi:PIN domain nuclease of toxin-antitoxin system